MFNPYHETEINDIAPTQTTCCGSTTSSATVLINNNERIRKLTPLECWRLMSFDDEDFYKAQSTGNSNSQLYKQAGNSIVVNVSLNGTIPNSLFSQFLSSVTILSFNDKNISFF